MLLFSVALKKLTTETMLFVRSHLWLRKKCIAENLPLKTRAVERFRRRGLPALTPMLDFETFQEVSGGKEAF